MIGESVWNKSSCDGISHQCNVRGSGSRASALFSGPLRSSSSNWIQGAHDPCVTVLFFSFQRSSSALGALVVLDCPGCGTQRPAPTWKRDHGGFLGKAACLLGLILVDLRRGWCGGMTWSFEDTFANAQPS